MKKIFFQSSLPRAGSTLLQNVIGQNPDFYVTPTSGVLELLIAARANYTNSPEFSAQDPNLMRDGFLGFCREGLNGFFEKTTDKPFILDKSRGWGYHYSFVNTFYNQPKMLCMVRDPRDIFCSMEKNFRKYPEKHFDMVNHQTSQGVTTESRIDIWASNPPVGMAMERLYQIIKEGNDKHIHFIKYETFTRQPEKEVEKIYDYLELPYFKHDFNNVEQITQEDDKVYGVFGDHNIKNKIEYIPSNAKEILGKGACDWIKSNYKWFYDYFRYT